MRDRRFDWLYERQKQPVKQYILERFAQELADELAAWPPADLEWESEALRARWGPGAAAPPRQAVLRLSLELARLDLARQFEAVEQLTQAGGALQGDAEAAAAHLLLRLLTERCLSLKEYADGARLTREDLVGALHLAERRLFRVTEG
ncbi:MAG: hypothetical protein IPO09_02680 [Anaeromyxobacter sp.]|nr:hypothetical protein [Anaeromyxobacter sp.]MBL0275488.1 hypothetical protein [Anaeromyxobacter sp.]